MPQFRSWVKNQIELFRGTFFKKNKIWVDIPNRLQFPLSSVFSKWLIFAMGLWSVKNQCYQILTYYISLVRKFNVEEFLQKKYNLKVCIFQVILKHACWTCYSNIYPYLYEPQVNIVCLKVFELLLYIKRVWNRYRVELCCISIFILLRVMVFISAEKPNLEYTWVYSLDWHLCKL